MQSSKSARTIEISSITNKYHEREYDKYHETLTRTEIREKIAKIMGFKA